MQFSDSRKMAERRNSYTARYKLKVVEFAKINGNRAAEREFGPPPTAKMIRTWQKQEDHLKKMPKENRHLPKHGAKWPKLEEELKIWILEHRQRGIVVSTKMVMQEAKKIAQAQDITDFKGGPVWCYRFRKRQGLAIRTRTKLAQRMPEFYEEKVLSFHKFVINTRQQFSYELSQIGNMDETPLNLDCPDNHTIDEKGAKTIAIRTTGHEKSHFTCVLTCMADGTKLPPLLIFKRKTLPKDKIPQEY